jgi:hypothetical protein
MRPAVLVLTLALGLALGLVLGGCAGDAARVAAPDKPDTGKWKFERRNDPVSRTQVTTAWLSIGKYDFLSGRTFAGEVQLMCFKRQPVVRFAFNVKIGTDKTATIAYRFDENPGHDVRAKFFARPKMIIVDNKAEVVQFVTELATSKSLYLRVSTLTVGNIAAKFPVHGAQHAIEAAFAECPLAPEKPRAKTSAFLSHVNTSS